MPGHSLIGSVATLDSSRVTWPREAGVDEAGRRVGQQAQPAETRLALEAGADVVRQGHDLVRRAEHELARVQDERLVAVRFDQPGQLGLLDRRVDVRVAVVLEHPEVAVDADVDAGGLDHRRVEGVETDPAGLDRGADVPVREQHTRTLSALPGRPRRGANMSEFHAAGVVQWQNISFPS